MGRIDLDGEGPRWLPEAPKEPYCGEILPWPGLNPASYSPVSWGPLVGPPFVRAV